MISILFRPEMNDLGAFALALVLIGAVGVVAVVLFHRGKR
jgi:hypothetical protein